MSRMSCTALFAVLALSLTASIATAQSVPPGAGPAAPSSPPPDLDTPDHWEIHGPSGDTGFEFEAQYFEEGPIGWGSFYVLTVTGTVRQQPYSSYAVVFDWGNGQVLDCYNGDSGLWTEWHWRGDHYEKVGGTANARTYHPVSL